LSVFLPRLNILPERQRLLWPSLSPLARNGFVLYGGTAIALRYGHRVSVDFDFFSARPLDRLALARALPWLPDARVLQDQPETLTVLSTEPALSRQTERAADQETAVKVSFFGGLAIGRLQDPDPSGDGVALVASPLDLLATKLKVMLQRAERKDYDDVTVLLQSGLALADGLAGARALYGPTFPISECLKALLFFGDGDLAGVPLSQRQQLEEAVLAIEVIHQLELVGVDLCP